MSSNKQEYIPKIKTPKEVINNAIEIIKAEASGEQLGLKTRYFKLNIALGKYFRFRQVYAIAGLSGHGKSTLLNSFIQDFLNPELNLGKCKYPYILAHHCFEMSPEDEELRKASAKLKVSYNYLLSSEFNNTSGEFNVLKKDEIEKVKEVLQQDIDKPLYYFDEPCELPQIGINIQYAIMDFKQKLFQDKERLAQYLKHYVIASNGRINLQVSDITKWEDIPSPKVVLLIDHTLLLKQAKEVYDILPENTKERISNEIQEYQDKFGLAGMDFDNDEWNKIKWLYSKKYHLPIKANKYNTDEWVDVIAVKGENGIYYSIPNMNEYHTVKEL